MRQCQRHALWAKQLALPGNVHHLHQVLLAQTSILLEGRRCLARHEGAALGAVAAPVAGLAFLAANGRSVGAAFMRRRWRLHS